MHGYKEPGFRERTAAAAEARSAALEKLRNRPAISPAEAERRKAAEARKDAVAAEKRAAARLARETAAAAKLESKREAARTIAESEQNAATKSAATESERKAARDARYASRKRRGG